MLWIKSLHIIAVICWMAGIFYLPRLFVYHAMSEDDISKERFKIMERKLYRGIMTPSAVLSIVFGCWLWWVYGFSGAWLHFKIFLVAILVGYHFWCGYIIKQFAQNNIKKSHIFFRWLNELPILLLFGIVILVVVKPTF